MSFTFWQNLLKVSLLVFDELKELEPEKDSWHCNDGDEDTVQGCHIVVVVNLQKHTNENQDIVDALRKEPEQPVLKPNRVPKMTQVNVLLGRIGGVNS